VIDFKRLGNAFLVGRVFGVDLALSRCFPFATTGPLLPVLTLAFVTEIIITLFVPRVPVDAGLAESYAVDSIRIGRNVSVSNTS